MNEEINNELTPLAYLKIFFRRKELLIIPAFIGLVLGVCTGILLPKEYMSSTIILVEEGKTDNPLFNELAVSTTVTQRIAAIKESMLGWNSLVKLVKRLQMDKDVHSPRELEDLVSGIRDHIEIKMQGNNIINLNYVGKYPEQTQAVVQNITDIFIERNMEVQNKETSDAIDFIEEQLKVYRGKIKSSEIAKLRDDLKVLLVDSTDEHPKVKQLREQIAAKEAELHKENLPYTENVVLNAQTANPMIQEIKAALGKIEGGGTGSTPVAAEKPQDDYYKVMLIDKLDDVMARDQDVNNRIYNMLLQRLESAKITQRLQSSKEGTRYTILDPPRIPLDPIKPNKFLVAIGGLIAGILIGFGLVVITEFLDKSFIDVEEVKQFLGVPLLGAISKINTEASILKDKERQRWLYSLTILSGIIVIVLTTAVVNFLK